MKFKLDENVDPRIALLLQTKGEDVKTVSEQGLGGATDRELSKACRREKRCLITLDLDFTNVLAYPPQDYSGIVVLRPPRLLLRLQIALAKEFAANLGVLPIQGRLWTVEPGRIRIFEPPKTERG